MSDETIPSAGIESEAAPSEAPPTTDVSALSDDEIYDSESPEQAQGEEPEQTPVEAQATEEKKQDDEEPLEDEEVPENYRNVFKKFPDLRRDHYAIRAFRGMFPQISEAREYKSLFPTLDEAKQVANEAASVRYMDNLFRSDPERLLAEMHQADPQAFRGMASATRSIYASDPQLYREAVAKPIVSDLLTNLAEIASGLEGDEGADLKTAIGIIAKHAQLSGSQPEPRAADDDPRIQDYERIKAREQEMAQGQWASFAKDVDEQFWSNLGQEVSGILVKANKGGALPAVLEMARNEVMADIWNEVGRNSYVNSALPSKMREMWGRPDQLAAWKMAYARPKIAAKVAAVMKRLTPQVVNKAKEQIRQAEKVNTRKDVGGQTGGTSAKPGKVDYRKLSDEDIYSGKHLVG
jgi:hypothetical protein